MKRLAWFGSMVALAAVLVLAWMFVFALVQAEASSPVPPADFDGDGDSDISLFRPSNGEWYIYGASSFSWGIDGDIPVSADYDGDSVVEAGVYRYSTGKWYIRGGSSLTWGLPGDVPVPCDYDANGRMDIAVYRPSTGKWYVKDQFDQTYGLEGDLPVQADYDGDGACDLAVYRPSTGKWYVYGESSFTWGEAEDIPVPADYDGDGDADAAVFRPSNGGWYVVGEGSVSWGEAEDIPVPGDYDGDLSMDIAVFRASEGRWLVKDQLDTSFGLDGDFPAPARDYTGDGKPYAIGPTSPTPPYGWPDPNAQECDPGTINIGGSCEALAAIGPPSGDGIAPSYTSFFDEDLITLNAEWFYVYGTSCPSTGYECYPMVRYGADLDEAEAAIGSDYGGIIFVMNEPGTAWGDDATSAEGAQLYCNMRDRFRQAGFIVGNVTPFYGPSWTEEFIVQVDANCFYPWSDSVFSTYYGVHGYNEPAGEGRITLNNTLAQTWSDIHDDVQGVDLIVSEWGDTLGRDNVLNNFFDHFESTSYIVGQAYFANRVQYDDPWMPPLWSEDGALHLVDWDTGILTEAGETYRQRAE